MDDPAPPSHTRREEDGTSKKNKKTPQNSVENLKLPGRVALAWQRLVKKAVVISIEPSSFQISDFSKQREERAAPPRLESETQEQTP
jgi:hypothetical protein